MKKKIIGSAVLVSFLLTIPVGAQTPTQTSAQAPASAATLPKLPAKPVVDTNSIVTNIQSQLKLTEAQVKAITPVIDEENNKLKKILTPAQMTQWLNLLNSMRLKQKKSKHNNAAGSPSKSK